MRLPLCRTLAVGALALAIGAAAPEVMALSGSVAVHKSDGSNGNDFTYTDPRDVYVYGTGLPQGEYYVHIRNTQGNAILGTSVGASDETPVVVGADGKLADLYQVWSLVEKTSDGTQGYDLTGSDWCEYRLCVSSTSGFEDENTVTDLFLLKVEEKEEQEEEEEETGTVTVTKFYDCNANGVRDSGESAVEDWKVSVDGPDGFSDTVYTPWSGDLAVGDYTFTEETPSQHNWVPTTDVEVSVSLGAGDDVSVEFGNLCLGDGGAKNPCEWLAKSCQDSITSGDLSALSSLCLVDPWGCSFNPSSKYYLKLYLFLGCILDNDCYTDSKCSNMAFLLSVHLAAMKLSVRHGCVDEDALVYAPHCGNTGVGNDYITVCDLIDAANAAIKDDAYTPPGDDDREWQECLKDALDSANNNFNFVCATPGTFSF